MTYRSLSTLLLLAGVASCAEAPTAPVVVAERDDARLQSIGGSTHRSDDVTIFLRPRGAIKRNARAALIGRGALRVSPHAFGGRFPIAVRVPRSAIDSIRALPWATIVEIDSSPPPRIAGSTGASIRSSSFGGRKFTEVVPWGVFDIGATQVHSNWSNTGAGVKIAVLDNGLDCTSPDLSGRIAGGYDYIANSATACTTTDGSHGTLVAHVIAAIPNSDGIVGVAPGASLYGVRVCDGGDCDTGALYDGLVWAYENDIDIVSASIANCGGTPNLQTRTVITALHNAGTLVIFSAGNGTDQPCSGHDVSGYAALSETIGVASYLSTGGYNSNFSYGSAVDFSAPTNVESRGPGNTPETFGGSSAAVPHVAGTAALLLSAGFLPSQVKDRLIETAQDSGATGKDDYYEWGMIRAAAAAVPKARVDSVTWCTGTAITVAGSCGITAYTTNGVPTVDVRFEVTFSNSSDTVVYNWGSPSRTLTIAAGDYSLTIKAIPRDQSYQRVGFYTFQTIFVCTGEALQRGGWESPNGTGGCGGGGSEEFLRARRP